MSKLNKARFFHKIVSDKKFIFCVGGGQIDQNLEKSIEQYCPVNDKWDILGFSLSEGCLLPGVCIDQDIIVFGGVKSFRNDNEKSVSQKVHKIGKNGVQEFEMNLSFVCPATQILRQNWIYAFGFENLERYKVIRLNTRSFKEQICYIPETQKKEVKN